MQLWEFVSVCIQSSGFLQKKKTTKLIQLWVRHWGLLEHCCMKGLRRDECFNGSSLRSGIKDVLSWHMQSSEYVCEYVCVAEEKARAVMNKQALYWLCDSAEPTKWEQISQDSSVSIRGFPQFFLLSTISCSHLMSSGFAHFWHFRFNKNWHAHKHACTHEQF